MLARRCARGLMTLRSHRALRLAFVLLIASVTLCPAVVHSSDSSDEQVCDPLADYYLGMEDYPAAIRQHALVITEHPDNALAHYHLGFAYGIVGQHRRELLEYRRAVALGLDDWQLFLNLGLAYLEENQFENATEVLRLATLLGPYQPETHFNLGLIYEKRGRLSDAEQEILLSLRLNPNEIDARNTLALIYAEEGRYALARAEWSDLLNADPAFVPARENLAILARAERAGIKSASNNIADFGHGR